MCNSSLGETCLCITIPYTVFSPQGTLRSSTTGPQLCTREPLDCGHVVLLQVKFEPGAPLFCVHTDVLTADGNTCRLSLGNILKAENIKVTTLQERMSLHSTTQHSTPWQCCKQLLMH